MTFLCDDCWEREGSPHYSDIAENPFSKCRDCSMTGDDGGLLVVDSGA